MTSEITDITADMKKEIVSLLDQLPVGKLKIIRSFQKEEIQKLDPDYVSMERCLHTIWSHLLSSLERGEWLVISDVHEFLLNRGNAPQPSPECPETSESTTQVDQAVS